MKLIHKETGTEVKSLEIVTSFRGKKYEVIGWRKPNKPSSTGRIHVRRKGVFREFFPSVFNCEWRED